MARMVRTVAAVMTAWAVLTLAPATAAPGDIFKTDAKATIDIGVDGSVEAVQLTGVPGEDAQRIYSEQIRQWRFEPILENGRAVPARAFAEMDVYVIETSDGSLQLTVGRPSFRSPPGTPELIELPLDTGGAERLESVFQPPPTYPADQARRGVEAEVVLLVEIEPSGEVARTGVWSAVFMNPTSKRVPDRAMVRFVAASKAGVARWRFNATATQGTRQVFVPIRFAMRDTDMTLWQKIQPLSDAREAWVTQAMASGSETETETVKHVGDVNDATNQFVLLNPPELPWM